MSDDVSITVNGNDYKGWESVDIDIPLESAAASFSLDVSDNDGTQVNIVQISDGDSCIVKIDGEKVITGYVDDVDPSFDASSHTIAISGRSKTADIVDCSNSVSGEWKGKRFAAIARSLTDPFGITVKNETSVGGVIDDLKLQPGDAVFDILDRAAKGIGVLLMSSANGELVIADVGSTSSSWILKEGVNIESGSSHFSMSDRFSKYTLLCTGSDSTTFSTKATFSDPHVTRFRPLIVVSQDETKKSYATKRIKWEGIVHAAKSMDAEITVQGWHANDGKIWWVNRLVNVVAKSLRLNTTLLITNVHFHKGDDGTTTILSLRRRDAYTQVDTAGTSLKTSTEPESKPNTPKIYKGTK